jgi:hypothetical protein
MSETVAETILTVVASYLGSQTGVERREGPIERGELLDPDWSSRKHWLVSDRSITCSAYDTLAFSVNPGHHTGQSQC